MICVENRLSKSVEKVWEEPFYLTRIDERKMDRLNKFIQTLYEKKKVLKELDLLEDGFYKINGLIIKQEGENKISQFILSYLENNEFIISYVKNRQKYLSEILFFTRSPTKEYERREIFAITSDEKTYKEGLNEYVDLQFPVIITSEIWHIISLCKSRILYAERGPGYLYCNFFDTDRYEFLRDLIESYFKIYKEFRQKQQTKILPISSHIYISKIKTNFKKYNFYLENFSKALNGITIFQSEIYWDKENYNKFDLKLYFIYIDKNTEDTDFFTAPTLKNQLTLAKNTFVHAIKSRMLLFIKEEKQGNEIFALTFDKETHEIIQNVEDIKCVVDINFPYKTGSHILDPKRVTYIKVVPLTGNLSCYSKTFNPPTTVCEVELFGSWCEELSCYVEGTKAQLHLAKGYISFFQKDITLLTIPTQEIIENGAEIVESDIIAAVRKLKNLTTILNIFSEYNKKIYYGDFKILNRIRLVDDFNLISELEEKTGDDSSSVKEIVLKGKLKKLKEGMFFQEGKKRYFKIKNIWLTISANFSIALNNRFEALMKEISVEPQKIGLGQDWKGEAEDRYNEKYLNSDSYLVGDKICSKKLVELFDILKKKNEEEIILYHIKKNLGNDTRVVCSQIYNAAKCIISSRMTCSHDLANKFIELLYGATKKSNHWNKIPFFKKFFGMKNQQNWKEMKWENRDLKKMDTMAQKLQNLLMKKFSVVLGVIPANKEELKPTVIARLAIIKLKIQLDELGVKLKICIISKS